MWPFKRSRSNFELLERVESLERRFKTLLADVEEYFLMVRKAENRIRSKERKIEQASIEQGEGGEASDLTVGSPFSSSNLSAHQKQVQQAILRRRGGIQ